MITRKHSRIKIFKKYGRTLNIGSKDHLLDVSINGCSVSINSKGVIIRG